MNQKQKKFLNTILHGGAHSFYKRLFELGGDIQEISNEVIKITLNNKTKYMRRNTIPMQKAQGQLAKDKCITKAVFKDSGIRVAKEVIIEKPTDIKEIKEMGLKLPLIVKPQLGTRAKGVTWNINTKEQAQKAVKVALEEKKGPALVEEMFIGEEIRVLIIDNKVISAVHKVPPTIFGDSKKTIKDLINDYNQNRKEEHKLIIDKEVRDNLKNQSYNLNSVLKKNQKLILKNTFLMSNGARLVAVTEILNKFYKEVCIRAVHALNLTYGGVDIIVKNITKSGSYIMLEVNTSPYYNMHEKELVEGKPVDISKLIILDLFKSKSK